MFIMFLYYSPMGIKKKIQVWNSMGIRGESYEEMLDLAKIEIGKIKDTHGSVKIEIKIEPYV